MPAPSSPTYSASALIAAHQAFLDTLDGAVTAAVLKIRDAFDVLLATVTLNDPAGTVNGSTGQLTFDIPAGTASGNGTAAYGEFCDGDGNVHLALPCQSGNQAASGYLVMNSLVVVSGQPINTLSATLG